MYIVYELVKHLHTCPAAHPPSSEMTPTSLSFADTPIPVMAPEGNCIIRSGDRLCGRQSKYGTQSCHTGWWHTQGRGHMTHTDVKVQEQVHLPKYIHSPQFLMQTTF